MGVIVRNWEKTRGQARAVICSNLCVLSEIPFALTVKISFLRSLSLVVLMRFRLGDIEGGIEMRIHL